MRAMKIADVYSHRRALEIVESHEGLSQLYAEVQSVLSGISDESIISSLLTTSSQGVTIDPETGFQLASGKSIAKTINRLIRDGFNAIGDWNPESDIFQDTAEWESDNSWRLDFSKIAPASELDLASGKQRSGMAVEVSFNHGEALAWNMLKPVLASEINHLDKKTNIGEGIGIVICATQNLKLAGGFDGVTGHFEKLVGYISPLRNILTIPTLILGLDEMETFHIGHFRNTSSTTKKAVVMPGKFTDVHSVDRGSRVSWYCERFASSCFETSS